MLKIWPKKYISFRNEIFLEANLYLKGDVPYFLEMNTVPGLTREKVILPKQAEHAISLEKLFTNAIDMA